LLPGCNLFLRAYEGWSNFKTTLKRLTKKIAGSTCDWISLRKSPLARTAAHGCLEPPRQDRSHQSSETADLGLCLDRFYVSDHAGFCFWDFVELVGLAECADQSALGEWLQAQSPKSVEAIMSVNWDLVAEVDFLELQKGDLSIATPVQNKFQAPKERRKRQMSNPGKFNLFCACSSPSPLCRTVSPLPGLRIHRQTEMVGLRLRLLKARQEANG
jgi:hypothetical protein